MPYVRGQEYDPAFYQDDMGFEDEYAETAKQGYAQGLASQKAVEVGISKTQEKTRRLEQTRKRKERELVGKDDYDYGTDNPFTREAKIFANMFLGHDTQIPVEFKGGQYTTQNKDFNSDDLTGIWHGIKEDPSGDQVLYYLRKEDGYNDDGTPKWLYKPGIAKYGAIDRYKDQLESDGWQLIGEKRTNNAAQYEARIHGNEAFLKERTMDYGKYQGDTFGSGKSELYNTDILGIDNLSSTEMDARKLLSEINAARKRKTDLEDLDGRFGNLVDGLQSRSVAMIAGMADAVYDVFSDDEHNALNDWKDRTKTDKLFGYNATTSASALDKAAMNWENGQYLQMLARAFSVAPELITESLPEMAAMMTGIGGLGAVTAMRSNDIMDEILENTGGTITPEQRIQALTGGVLMTALDKFGLDEVIGRSPLGKILIKKVFSNSTEQASKGIAIKLIEKTAQLSVAGTFEAGTEMLQDITEQYAAKFGTRAEGKLWSDEMWNNIVKAGLGGYAAGAVMRGGADFVQGAVEREGVKSTLVAASDKVLKADDSVDPLTDEQKAEFTEMFDESFKAMDESTEPELTVYAAEDILQVLRTGVGEEVYGEDRIDIIKEIEAKKAEAMTEVEAMEAQELEIDTMEPREVVLEDEVIEEEEAAAPDIAMTELKESDSKYQTQRAETLKNESLTDDQKDVRIKNLDIQRKARNEKILEKFGQPTPEEKITPEPKPDDDVPGPLRAFAKRFKDVVLQKIEPMLTEVEPKFLRRLENVSGKAKEIIAGIRKREARAAELVTDDTNILNVFNFGAADPKTMASTKTKAKQTLDQRSATVEAKNKLVSSIKGILKAKKISKSEILNNDFNELFQDIDENKNQGGALRLAVLGLEYILSDIKSNVDRANNSGYIQDRLYASRQNIAKEIGRAFIASYGHILVKAEEGSTDEAIDRHYLEVGNVALAMLEDMGYITHMPEGQGIADTGYHDMVDLDNRTVKPGETMPYGKQQVAKLSGEDVIFLAGSKVIGKIENKASNTVFSDLSEMLSPMIAALNPANQRDPSHTPNYEDIRGDDHQVSDDFNDIVVALQAEALYIKEDTMELLKEIVTLTDHDKLSKIIQNPDNAWIRVMFDLDYADDVIDTEKTSVTGKYQSRLANADAIIQAVRESVAQGEDVDPRKLFFSYFSAVNQRIHVDEIAFNFQSDNFFARHILSPVKDTYTTGTPAENEALILAVSEELGIDPADIMVQNLDTESGTVLNGLNAVLNFKKPKGIKWFLNPKVINSKQLQALFTSGKSPNSVIKAIQAVAAIRAGVQESNGDWKSAKIKSNYSIEYDGNTSGLINKMLNMLGGKNHEAVLEIVRKLTVPDPDTGNILDGYKLLSDEVRTILADQITEAKENILLEDAGEEVAKIEKLINFIDLMDKGMRGVSKGPMMTNIYGQMLESLKRGLGFDLATDILAEGKAGKHNQAQAMETLEALFGQAKVVGQMTNTDKRALAAEIGELMGGIFHDALNNVNKNITEDSAAMYRSYTLLERASRITGNPLVMRSPYDVVKQALEGKDYTGDSDFSIEKKKIVKIGQAITGEGQGTVVPTEEVFMGNENSQKVMPLHAIDTAILLLAYDGTLKALGLTGSMPIHDAVYSTPEFMIEYRKQYNKAAIDVARHYDLVDETILQMEEAIEALETQESKNQNLIDEFRVLRANLQEQSGRTDLKNAALDELSEAGAEVFGTTKFKMPEGPIDPIVKPKPVAKGPETKPESTMQEQIDEIDSIFGTSSEPGSIVKDFLRNFANKEKAMNLLDALDVELGSKSKQHIDTLRSFVETAGKVAKGKILQYLPSTDEVIITDRVMEVKNAADVIKYLAHEVEHRSTAQHISDQSKLDSKDQEDSYKYVKRVLGLINNMTDQDAQALIQKYDGTLDSFNENIASRFEYVRSETSEYVQMAELVAIYRTNADFREFLNKEVMPNQSVITKFIKSIKELVNSAMAKFMHNGETAALTMEILDEAMNNLVQVGHQARLDALATGQTAKSVQAANITGMIDASLLYKPYKGLKPLFFLPLESKITVANRYIHAAFDYGILVPGKKILDSDWVQNFHKENMSNPEGIYYRTVETINERLEPGTLLSRIIRDMGLKTDFDPDVISQLHTLWNKAQQARNQVDTDMLIKSKHAFDDMTKEYSKDEKKTIEKIFNSSLVHVLNNTQMGVSFIDTILNSTDPMAEIEQQIEDVQRSLTTGTKAIVDQSFTDYGVPKLAKDVANFYRNRILGNLANMEISDSTISKTLKNDYFDRFNLLVALEQLKMGGKEELATLSRFKEDSATNAVNLYDEFMIMSRSNAALAFEVDRDIDGKNQYKFDSLTGSHVLFEENYEFITGTKQEFANMAEDVENKWIILQEPSSATKTLGVAARLRDDFGKQAGIVSHTNLNSDGIPLSAKEVGLMDLKNSNIAKSGTGTQYEYKVVLSDKMLSKLKVRTHASSVLYRSYGHNEEIFRGRSALKHILEKEVTIVDSKFEADKLEKLLLEDKKPMFLKLDLTRIKEADYPEIFRHYQKVVGLTNVLGFNKRVNMVHKDLKDQFVGYTKHPLTDKNNVLLRKAERVLRDLVTMFKGHVVMGNPAKITMDTLSNGSILLANNVPFKAMVQYGLEAARLAPDLVRLRNRVILLELQVRGLEVDSEQQKAKKIELKRATDDLFKHPFAPAMQNGFIQSLATSMMMKDREAMSGLQGRLDKLFKQIGEIPGVEEYVMKFADYGVGIEDVLTFARRAVKRGGNIDEELKYMAEKFERIKSEKDMAAYLSEIVATPGQSEILRLGGLATLGVDLGSKWILYKHTLDEMSDDKTKTSAQKEKLAADLALNSFIDYRKNLPHELDMLSDLGIWMFPQFMLRIQKIIWSLMYNKAIGSGTGIASALIAGQANASIFASAIPFKFPAHIDGPSWNMVAPAEITNMPFI